MQTVQVHYTVEVSLERAKERASSGEIDVPTAARELVREVLEAASLDTNPSTNAKRKKG